MEKNNEEKKSDFKAVKNKNNYDTVIKEKKVKNEKGRIGFVKGILIPFASGLVGCSVVLGTCFGVPSIKSAILSNNNFSTSQKNNNSGIVNQASLSNYSNTSVYVANKILPSIVGIEVEYNVNSMFSMFGRQARNS